MFCTSIFNICPEANYVIFPDPLSSRLLIIYTVYLLKRIDAFCVSKIAQWLLRAQSCSFLFRGAMVHMACNFLGCELGLEVFYRAVHTERFIPRYMNVFQPGWWLHACVPNRGNMNSYLNAVTKIFHKGRLACTHIPNIIAALGTVLSR